MKHARVARPIVTLFTLLMIASLPGCSSWVSPQVSPPPVSYDMAPGADEAWVLETRDSDYLLIYGQWWLPDNRQPPRAIVLLLHGTSVHSGFYHPMAEYYARQGVAVFGIDLRGWGQSQGFGRRGQITDYSDYLTDVRTAAEAIRDHYPDTPLFIQGESMGGTIALLSQIRDEVHADGMILNAPAVQPGLFFGPLRTPQFLARSGLATLSVPGRLAPNMPIPLPWGTLEHLGVGLFLKEEENQQRFLNDPHSQHKSLPWSYLSSLRDAVIEVRGGLAGIDTPVLIQQGTKDMLVPVYSSEQTIDALASEEKQLAVYEGLTHATVHDRERERVWQDALDWVSSIMDDSEDGLALHPASHTQQAN